MIALAVLAKFQIVGADEILVAGSAGPFPSSLVEMLSRDCRMSGAALLASGKSAESQEARHILAREGFEDREAAAELSELKLNRAETKISERLLMGNRK